NHLKGLSAALRKLKPALIGKDAFQAAAQRVLALQAELKTSREKRDAVAGQLADFKDSPKASAPADLAQARKLAEEFARRFADGGARFKKPVKDLEGKLRAADENDRGPLAQQLREWRDRLDAEISRGQTILKALQLLIKKTDPGQLGDIDKVVKE